MTAKKEATLKVVEDVIDVADETVHTLERIPKLWLNGTTKGQQILILSVTAGVGAVAAAGATWAFVNKRLKAKFEEELEQEIASAKSFYSAMNKPSLQDVMDERLPAEESPLLDPATDALKGYQGRRAGEPAVPYHQMGDKDVSEGEVDPKVTQNIFVEGKPMSDDFDYEAEIAARSVDQPYIISQEEYMQGEQDYVQVTLTYYAGDDVLVDDKDQPIEDSDACVGDLNMHRFGHGSKDNNVVYIRNDRMENDFEVLRSNGEYTKEVLGFRHSERGGSRKQPRYRGEDG